jgi:hypothetical protein
MRELCHFTTDELNTVADHVRYEVATLVETHRKSGDDTPIGFIMLGCTHYPLVQKEIATEFERLRTLTDKNGTQPYAKLIRDKLTFINPAEFTAKELFRELARKKLRLQPDETHLADHDTFFMSVPNRDWPGIQLTNTGALDQPYKHSRKLNDFTRNDTPSTMMTPDLLPTTTSTAIEHLMPEVWQRLAKPNGK